MNTTTPNDKLIGYRQSALAAASCLYRFNQIYNRQVLEESDEARRGSAFHFIVLEEYIPRLIKATLASSLELLEEAFAAGIVAMKTPAHLIPEVEDLVWRWGRTFELNREALLEAEERQRAHGFTWKPDLTYAIRSSPRGSVLKIEDLKTYHVILTEEAIRREFQGQFYIWQAMKIWPGFDVYQFAMTFVRYNVTTTVEYTPADLASLERRVQATIAVIEDATRTDTWPAQPGEHCGFCRLACPVVDDDRVLDRRILSAEESSIVAGRVLVLKRLLKADEQALRAWCATEGPARAGAMEFAHREVVRQKWAIPFVLEACAKAEVAPPEFECGKTPLRKLIGTKTAERRHPWLFETITNAARSLRKTRFEAKKIGNVAPEDDEPEEDAGD